MAEKKLHKDYIFPVGERKTEIFNRAVLRELETGEHHHVVVAAHLLDLDRHIAALESPDSTLQRLSFILSNGTNTICSTSFMKAHLDHLDYPERVSVLDHLYQTGSPVAVVNPFSDLKND